MRNTDDFWTEHSADDHCWTPRPARLGLTRALFVSSAASASSSAIRKPDALAACTSAARRKEVMDQGHEEYQVPTGVGLTALAMAAVRASESRRPDRLFDDPFAEDFLSTAGPAVALEVSSALGAWLASWLPVRTRFFDDYLVQACAAGCVQVVVLAAGLDARAFRLGWPQGVRLFELDLPEVLAFKESVLATRGATPACHRGIISADLRENWPQGLVQAGFRVGEPTAWLAEGLLVYLTAAEKDRLVDQVGQLSASGSRLAVSYASRTAGLAQASGGSPGDALFKTLRRSDYD